jgi:glycine betaine/choline ABC-type transport system substrate-binding protein
MKARTGSRSRWPALAVALTLALAALLLGCGDSSKVTLRIGVGDTAEEAVLGQIYAQALKGAGFDVEKTVTLHTDGPTALERGTISGYTGHLNSTLTSLLGREPPEVPGDPQKAFEELRPGLEKKGLTAFPPTPFSFTNLVGALKKTADERGLKTISDLKGQSEELTIAGVTGCHESIDCVEGLERLYGLAFGGFIYKVTEETEPFQALETGFSDLAMLPSTDGRLATERGKLVTLEDDKHLFPAGNAIFVTTTEVAEEAGPAFEEAIVAAQRGLTLAVMQKLDAEVEIEKQSPTAVAAKYSGAINKSR